MWKAPVLPLLNQPPVCSPRSFLRACCANQSQRGINEKQNPHLYSPSCETVDMGRTMAAGRKEGQGPPSMEVIIVFFFLWKKKKCNLNFCFVAGKEGATLQTGIQMYNWNLVHLLGLPTLNKPQTYLSLQRQAAFINEYHEIVKLCVIPARAVGLWSWGMSMWAASLAPALEWHSEGINRGRPTDHCARQNVASAVLGSAKCLRSLLNRSPFLFPSPSPCLSSILISASPLYVVVCAWIPFPTQSPSVHFPALSLFSSRFLFLPRPSPQPQLPFVSLIFPSSPQNPPTPPPYHLSHIRCHVLSAVEQPRFQFRV